MIQESVEEKHAQERRRRAANLRRLHLTLWRQALQFAAGRVLVVAQKRIVAQLQALDPLPGNIVWAHHGAVTGRDDWRDVRAVIVVGRAMPPPAAVERQAEALTGAPVARLPRGTWYPQVDATREMADGSLVACEGVRHPDPIAEAFRWRACEGELVQIIERARAVNRQSDAERVDVIVLTDAPLPLPVETLISADDVAPRVEDRMLATGGMVVGSSENAAAAYPKLWRNGNAVRVARHRERERYGGDWQPLPGLISLRFRRAANGAHHDVALFDPAVIADPVAHLRAVFGDLAYEPVPATLQPPQKDSPYAGVMERPASSPEEPPSWAVLGPETADFVQPPPDS